MDKVLATVVICTRDRSELFENALRTAARAVAQAEGTQLLVIEQGDSSAAETCHRLGVTVELVRDDAFGLAHARNTAARIAEGEVLIFTDDDCEVPDSWALEYLAAFSDRTIAAAFGPTQGMNLPQVTGRVSRLDKVALSPWLIGHGANMAVRKEALAEIGGFDERLGAGTRTSSGEDADLIVRLLLANLGILANFGAPVRHRDWRAAEEVRRARLGYERGTGAWIGKVLRTQGATALPYLLTRLRYLRDESPLVRSGGGVKLRDALAAISAFGHGLLLGLSMQGGVRWRNAGPATLIS